MNALTWRRVGALSGSVTAAALTLAAVRGVTACYERELAEQSAVAIASYLSIAAPAARGGPDYDLAQLLIQAHALVALLEMPQIEVYHATAPLVHAVAPPLRPDELERLRREETTGWDGNAALAPLLDRESWDVVGAVRVPRQRLDVAWLEWGLPALLLVTVALAVSSALAVGRPAVLPRALMVHTAAALVVGCVAYIAVRTTAKRATDQWLVETGALVQEATTHAPGSLDVADVAGLVRGGTLAPAELVLRDPTPRRRNHGVASVVVRMGGGRWAELRTPAAEAATGIWFLCAIGLALLGPAGVWIAARAER
jgi:hypothetical protein